MLHLKITMMLLFANIVLTLFLPGQVLSGNIFYQESGDSFTVNEQLTSTTGDINPSQGGLVLNALGIVDVFKLLVGVIDLMIRLFFAAFFVLVTLPAYVALLVGVPLIIAYAYAIWGFVR